VVLSASLGYDAIGFRRGVKLARPLFSVVSVRVHLQLKSQASGSEDDDDDRRPRSACVDPGDHTGTPRGRPDGDHAAEAAARLPPLVAARHGLAQVGDSSREAKASEKSLGAFSRVQRCVSRNRSARTRLSQTSARPAQWGTVPVSSFFLWPAGSRGCRARTLDVKGCVSLARERKSLAEERVVTQFVHVGCLSVAAGRS